MAQETILVTGGCGFIGYHILRLLKEQQPDWALHGMSRDPTRNLITGVEYHSGSISVYDQVLAIYQKISPTVIIHAASPAAVTDSVEQERNFFTTNVDGTKILLNCAVAIRTVKAFIYTSSAVVLEGLAHHMATEDAPVKSNLSTCDSYSKSKALADTLVLNSNRKGGVLTACLRLPSVYGALDEQTLGEGLRSLRRKEHKLQIGDNSNMCDWLSAANAAQAHLLTIKALLAEKEQQQHQQSEVTGRGVAGEAFFITDGEPLPFWQHFREIWKAAGDRTPENEITVVSPWIVMTLARVIEIFYFIVTLGTRKPTALRRDLLQFTFVERTFSIDKARTRLKYVPAQDRKSQIREGVNWFEQKYPVTC